MLFDGKGCVARRVGTTEWDQRNTPLGTPWTLLLSDRDDDTAVGYAGQPT